MASSGDRSAVTATRVRRYAERSGWARYDAGTIAGWLAPGVCSCILVLSLGLDSGGYLPRPWRLGTFSVLALSAAALVGRRHVVVGRLEWLFFGALAALTAWTAASTAWSGDQVTPFLEAERLLLYLAVVVAVLVSVDRAQVPSLLGGVVAGVTLVSAYGLERYLTSVPVLNRVEGYLLFKPLGYANGFGIYAAIAMVLAIGLALAYPRLPVLVCAAVALGVLGTTLYYTSSRAALVAMCAGVVTIIGLRRPRLGLALAGLGVVAIAVALVVSPATSGQGLAAQLVGENRPHYWSVAWKEYTQNPILGSGAGTFSNYWLHYRPIPSYARDAHSLYIESLAELGPIGLALVLASLSVPLLALRRRATPLVATAAGAYVTALLHTGIDWDWELPAVAVVGLLCGSAVLVGSREEGAVLGLRSRLGLLALAVGFAVFALVRVKTGTKLPFGP